MLAPAFVAQIQQRFSHEKRARVCVWFDPQEEFRRWPPAAKALLQLTPIARSNLLRRRRLKLGEATSGD